MTRTHSPALLLAASALSLSALSGCGLQAPYPLSLSVQSKTSAQATAVAYRVVEGDLPGEAGDVAEQKGVVGAGENCIIARQTSGTLSSNIVYEQQHAYNVVGETLADLPLVPGEHDEWSDVPVSVLKETTQLSSWVQSTETFVNPDPDAEVVQWEETRYSDGVISTSAGYFGVAADEYLVRMEMADLWEDLEEVEPEDVTLLTRHQPEEGDVWPSVNGNSLYVYVGTEDLNLAGTEMKKADKVAVYATGNVQASSGAGVFEQCLNLGLEQVQSSDPNVEDSSVDSALLDPGCSGSFVHVQQGTQWWYGNVLVQSDTADTVVTVTDYGFEWFVEDADAGTCTRQTSTTRDEPTAKAYIEYTVTQTAVTQAVTSYTE